jgi:hypothetical protein
VVADAVLVVADATKSNREAVSHLREGSNRSAAGSSGPF